MGEVDEFLTTTMPQLYDVEVALHNGDAEPRAGMWSHNDPVTLFGARLSASGWEDISGVFRELAVSFSDCTAYEVDLVAAGASGDLAYTVAFEHAEVSINGEPQSVRLRVTQIYRREGGVWKLVHRHGDVRAAT